MSLLLIVPEHVATRALLGLASARRNVMAEMGRRAGALNPAPTSVIVFGSFARGDDDAESDIDVVVVRPVDICADDHAWLNEIENSTSLRRRLMPKPSRTRTCRLAAGFVGPSMHRCTNGTDVKHLLWLRNEVGSGCIDTVIINTGPEAYRRPDGIAVVPLGLVGP